MNESDKRLDGKKQLEEALAAPAEFQIHYPSRDSLLAALCNRVFGAMPVFNDDKPKPELPGGQQPSHEACLKIIAEALRVLPVGYIPSHTPESISDRIHALVKENVELNEQLEIYEADSVHSCHINCKRPNCALRRELKALRLIFPQILEALGNGAQCTDECSLEFLQEIPKEVELYTDKLRKHVKSGISWAHRAADLEVSGSMQGAALGYADEATKTLNSTITCENPSASS